MQIYSGHCHCGAIRFRVRSEPITEAVRCNCSICIRKSAVMSTRYFSPEEFEELTGLESLSLYRFGDHMVNHLFCKTCGVYPFHDATTNPGHYRLNLGCIDGLDVLSLPVRMLDGKSF
jgi:hypothetical protein